MLKKKDMRLSTLAIENAGTPINMELLKRLEVGVEKVDEKMIFAKFDKVAASMKIAPYWTPFQLKFLQRYYGKLPTSLIISTIGKTRIAIHSKASSLGLKHPVGHSNFLVSKNGFPTDLKPVNRKQTRSRR